MASGAKVIDPLTKIRESSATTFGPTTRTDPAAQVVCQTERRLTHPDDKSVDRANIPSQTIQTRDKNMDTLAKVIPGEIFRGGVGGLMWFDGSLA